MRRFIVVVGILALVVSAAALASGGKQEEVTKKLQAEMKKIDARLKLTPEQKTQIKGMIGEEANKINDLYAQIEPQENAIRSEYRDKIRAVLTPAQQTEWDKIKGEYKEKWHGKSEKAEKSEKSEK